MAKRRNLPEIKIGKAARRETHFEMNRPLSEWTPGTKVHSNRKEKRQNRRTRRESAINEENEDGN